MNINNETISVDQQNGKLDRVSKYMKFVLHAAEFFITGENKLSRSTGYIEYNNINSKIDKAIRTYEIDFNNVNKDSVIFSTPQKRRKDIWEGNYPKRTNKPSKINDRILQSLKYKVYEDNFSWKSNDYNSTITFPIFNDFDFFSCPDNFNYCSYDTIKQFDYNYSFSVDEYHYPVDFKYEDIREKKQKIYFKSQNDYNNTLKTQCFFNNTEYTQWEVINKQKKNEIFLNDKEKLHVLYDNKKRINGYFVSFDLSQDSDIDETELNENELRAIEILSKHSNIDKQPIDWENTEDLYKIGYCNFKLPPRDLASDVFRCEECKSVPKYEKIEKLVNSSKFGDFSGLMKDQKSVQNPLEKNKTDELKKKIIKKVTNIKNKNMRNTKNQKKISKCKSNMQIQEINITDTEYKILDDINSNSIDLVSRQSGKYKCSKCDSTFTSAYGRKYHVKKVHTIEKELIIKPYQCNIENCIKKYKTRNGLKYHQKKHHALNVVCK